MQSITTPTNVGPDDGKAGFLGSIGVRFMIDGTESDDRFSLVEHLMTPSRARRSAAPAQPRGRVQLLCSRDDTGRQLLGDDVVETGPGDLVFKLRGQWHTFGNAGDEPCRIFEIIAPAGFEGFFDELEELGGAVNADPQALAELSARYELEMDPTSIPGLLERFDLRVGEPR